VLKNTLAMRGSIKLQSADSPNIHKGRHVPHIFIAHSMDPHDSCLLTFKLYNIPQKLNE
jgi:hypothetical protein